jgi:hypothetical protein
MIILFSLTRFILYFECRTLLRPTLPAVIEARRRNVGMPQSLLYLGDVSKPSVFCDTTLLA